MGIKKDPCFRLTAWVLAFALSLSLSAPWAWSAEIQNIVDIKDTDNVLLYIGDLVTVKVHSLTRIAVANPGIVDISSATADEMVLVGRKVGDTPIFLWDEKGKHKIVARVLAEDLSVVASRVAAMINSAKIDGVYLEKNYMEGKIVLTGVLNTADKKKLDDILKDLNPYLINLVAEQGDLIEIDVQIAELSKTLSEALGIDWTSPATTAGGAGGFDMVYNEASQATTGKFADLFKIGNFSRTSLIQATVSALINEGKGRILSQPSIVVTNGEEATFNVGGEIPIRTTSTSGTSGTVQENVTFKDYGIDLNVTPEIKDGKIDIKLDVQIRDIDNANKVGDNVAFTTRKAQTKLLLDDGQLIVMAGLIKRSKSEAIKRIPFLSRIPLVGILFKSYQTPAANSDLELVISLRPRIFPKTDRNHKNNLKQDVPQGMPNNIVGIPVSKELKKPLTQEEVLQAMDTALLKAMDEENNAKSQMKKKAVLPKAAAPEVKKAGVSPQANIKPNDKVVSAAKVDKNKKDKVKKKKKSAEVKKPVAESKKSGVNLPDAVKIVPATKASANEKQITNASTETKAVNPTPANAKADMTVSANANHQTKQSADEPINVSEDIKIPEPQNVLTDDQIKVIKEKYLGKIKQEMSETISYPFEAKQYGWNGTVTLDVTILPDGNVKDVRVNQSSGRAIFDKDAVNTAQILSPYEPFSPAKNLRELTVTVPVVYSENAIIGSKDNPQPATK